jgi:tetratricopeptide (TPR) repeat protein
MTRRAALIVFLTALAARLINVGQIRGSPYFDTLMGDARGYDVWAQRIAGGDWIGTEVFYQAPLYPYFLGLLYSIAGRDLLAARLVQSVLGASAAVLLGIAATRLISSRAGLIAGLGLALYAPAIFFDGLLQKSTLDGFLVCLTIERISAIVTGAGPASARRDPAELRRGLAEAAFGREGGRRESFLAFDAFTWLTLGLALGLLALSRENAMVFVAVVAIWALVGPGDREPETRTVDARTVGIAARLLPLAAGLAIVLAPVAARNAMVGGGFYITTAQFGPNFYIGNNPLADGTYMSLRQGRGAPEFERQDATELAEQDLKRTLTPAEVSSYWTGRALAFIRSQPGAWLALMARKVALVWNADEMLDTEAQESYAEWSALLAVLGVVGHFGVLVPLAVIGVVLTWPRRSRLWVLLALTAAYAASVVAFFVFARYRFPLVPFLILFAAAGVDALPREWPRLTRIRRRWMLAAAAAAAVFAGWPILSPDLMRAISETNLATALQESGRPADAIAHYQRALQIRPDYAPAVNNLGIVRVAAGDLPGAISAFREQVRLQPQSAPARQLLGDALYDAGSERLERGDAPQAERLLRESLVYRPGRAETHNNLGIALAQQGRLNDAVLEWREALRIRPDFADARRNLEMAAR